MGEHDDMGSTRNAAATVLLASSLASAAGAQTTPALDVLHARLDKAAEAVMPKVVTWRRDLHATPELGNHEVRTSAFLADQLRKLGYEVQTGVARTGVVALLKGGRPGPVVALRADMDALPVTEETGLPFASKARGQYNGREVGVMHACGHDFHMSMLLGAAEVLAGMKADLPGTVKIVFQPAEEGVPGEPGGAEVMVKEGVLEDPKVDAMFGLHVGITPLEAGSITFRPKGLMAAGDTYRIVVTGRQTHGAMPWAGVDPIVVASQIVLGLQTIVSRQIDLTTAPAVVTVGTIEGGSRHNIVPDQVRMSGTIRTFDPEMRKEILARVKRTGVPGHMERPGPDRAHDAVAQAGRCGHVQSERTADDDIRGLLVLRAEGASPLFLPGRGAEGCRPGRMGSQPLAPLQPG
jgi:amidohydrolase